MSEPRTIEEWARETAKRIEAEALRRTFEIMAGGVFSVQFMPMQPGLAE